MYRINVQVKLVLGTGLDQALRLEDHDDSYSDQCLPFYYFNKGSTHNERSPEQYPS